MTLVFFDTFFNFFLFLFFSGGKRLCAGETFARNTIFLSATAILQNFNLRPINDKSVPSLDDTTCGLIRIPNDFWVKLEAR